MIKFCTLSSSSSGNCSLLRTETETFLIDAGISCKAIVKNLKSIDIYPDDINGIFITHEHLDHVKGLNVFLKKYNIPIYSSKEVLEYLLKNNLVPINSNLVDINNANNFLNSVDISYFDTPHDSIHSIGFRINSKNASIGIVTDLGYMTDDIRKTLNGCKLLLIESNYDKNMLESCEYPYYLKRRIMGNNGHLCNEDCANELYSFINNGTEHIILAHLSENSNLPALAKYTALHKLSKFNIKENIDFTICTAPKIEKSEIYTF